MLIFKRSIDSSLQFSEYENSRSYGKPLKIIKISPVVLWNHLLK